MKRRKLPPDDRLDWRDPNMPVIRKGYRNGLVVDMEVAPDKVRAYYSQKIDSYLNTAPHYKDDPTYNLRKKK